MNTRTPRATSRVLVKLKQENDFPEEYAVPVTKSNAENDPVADINKTKYFCKRKSDALGILCRMQSIHSQSLYIRVYFTICHLDYMFRPLYILGHHQVSRLIVLLTCTQTGIASEQNN